MRLLVLFMALVLLCAACCAVWAGDTKAAPAKSKVLFLVGGPYHDQPVLYPMLQKWLEDTGFFTVTVSKDLDQLKAENIKNYDLVIMYTTRLDPTKEQEQGLVNFVANGKGIVGIHNGATDTFRDSDAYWKLMGGRFRTHGHETFKVNITGKSHSVVKGMSAFDINDETYSNDFHPESKVIVLARRDKDSEPSAWIQYYGKGRVFATGLGHDKEAWDCPAFAELIKRGSEWATFRLNP